MMDEAQATIRRSFYLSKVEEIYKQSRNAQEFRQKLEAFIKENNATCEPEDKLGKWGH